MKTDILVYRESTCLACYNKIALGTLSQIGAMPNLEVLLYQLKRLGSTKDGRHER